MEGSESEQLALPSSDSRHQSFLRQSRTHENKSSLKRTNGALSNQKEERKERKMATEAYFSGSFSKRNLY